MSFSEGEVANATELRLARADAVTEWDLTGTETTEDVRNFLVDDIPVCILSFAYGGRI